jgi:hypothetical protein
MGPGHPRENPGVSTLLGLLLDLQQARMIFCARPYLAGAAGRTQFIEELCIYFLEFTPLRWDIIFVINSFNGADGFAGATINAFIGLYIKHPITFIDAINWTLLDTGLVLYIDTRKCDYVCHG